MLKRCFLTLALAMLPIAASADGCDYGGWSSVQYEDGYFYLVQCTSWTCYWTNPDGSQGFTVGMSCDQLPMF